MAEQSHYIADTLTIDEYVTLDCLVTAQQNNETPISPDELSVYYELMSDVSNVDAALHRLNELHMAIRDPNRRWSPTEKGIDVAMFREKTRLEGR